MSERFEELSVDIETVGTEPGDAVVSIGAFPFSVNLLPLEMEPFEVRVSLIDCIAVGLRVDRETAQWWSEKHSARQTLETATVPPATVREAIEALRNYLQTHCVEKPRVWMKGPDFDGVLLKAMAKAVDMKLPWPYYRARCVRTICDGVDEPKRVESGDIAHTAAADAIHQARWVRDALLSKQVLAKEGPDNA